MIVNTLKNCTNKIKMSPEPMQEPIEDNLKTSGLNLTVTNDSESEDEDAGMDGYMPLSQIPLDGESMLDDDNDDDDDVCFFFLYVKH